MRVRGVLWMWGMASACVVLIGGCAGDTGNAGDGVDPAESGTSVHSVEPGSGATAAPGTGGSASSATDTTSLSPVPKALDGAAVEKSVRSVLTGSYGIAEVERVSCPAQPLVREGAVFDCTAFIAGEQRRVPIKIVNGDGVYEVGLPV